MIYGEAQSVHGLLLRAIGVRIGASIAAALRTSGGVRECFRQRVCEAVATRVAPLAETTSLYTPALDSRASMAVVGFSRLCTRKWCLVREPCVTYAHVRYCGCVTREYSYY